MNCCPARPRLPAFLLGLIASCCLGLATLSAQPAPTGSIRGRIFNPASGVYVRDAEIRVTPGNLTALSEADGSYELVNVPAGMATLTVNYTGYETAPVIVTVAAGQTMRQDFELRSTAATGPRPKEGEVVQLSAFTVSSEREGNSKAIMAQRRNMNISTSVSSDIFGDVTDGNVGEFLKYLPGVDLDYVEAEARGPRLGGMDGQYVGVSFDGMRTASADANRGGGSASRATSFEGFSITSIESIEINRTASAENDADSPAGTINMKTKRAFDRKGRTFDYNLGVNLNSEEFTLARTYGPMDRKSNKAQPNYQLSYAESFFNQRFGVLVSASRANSYTESRIVNPSYNASPTAADPRPLVVRQITFKDGPKDITKDALLLTADWKVSPHLTVSVNYVYSMYDGQSWNRDFTFVAANDNSNVNNGRATVGGDGMTTVIATRAPSGNVNNVATLSNGNLSNHKFVHNRQIAPRFEFKAGSLVVDGSLAYSGSKNRYQGLASGINSSEGGTAPGSWIATRPSRDSWEWEIRQTSGNDWFDLRSFTDTSSTTRGGTRVFSDERLWITEKWTGNLNARWALPFLARFPTVLKTGGKWDEETRNNNLLQEVSYWSYNGPGGNTTGINPTTGTPIITSWGNWANVGPEYISPNPFDLGTTNGLRLYNINGVQGMAPRVNRNTTADLFNAHPELFVNTTTPENYYTAYFANPRNFRQTMKAGYVQTDTKVTRKLQMRVGVRMERTQNAVTEFDPRTRAEVIAAGYPVNAVGTNNGRALTIPGLIYQFTSQPRVVRRSEYDNYFPSILFKYQILSNFEFQTGFNRGMMRPPIDNLTGLWVVNESNQTVSAPNPELLPEKHQNFQARLAYYFGGRSPGQLSAAVAQDRATNFVSTQNYTASEFGVEDPLFSGYTFVTTRNDDRMQRTRNLDLNYNQTLGFLPTAYLRGISLGANLSRTYVNVRRNNVAPWRATARLGYSYKRFNGSFGLVHVKDKPSGNYGQFFGEITKYDLSASFRLTKWASLYVQGRNISNVKDMWYQSPPGVTEGEQRALRQINAFGANWVFGLKGQF
jgi:iron complex outermembrane receptor protein